MIEWVLIFTVSLSLSSSNHYINWDYIIDVGTSHFTCMHTQTMLSDDTVYILWQACAIQIPLSWFINYV